MSLLNQIKQIDQRTKDVTFGFIRESTKSIKYTTIPMMINYICLLYYYVVFDKFIRCGKSIKIESSNSKNNNIATSTPSVSSHYGSIHGNVIINPRRNPQVIATWTIKVNTSHCAIGIHSAYGTNSISFGSKYINYGWKGDGTIMEPNAGGWSSGKGWFGYDGFGSGDVIKIELNIAKKQLKFYKNDEETDFEIGHIDLRKNYHLMVELGRKQRFETTYPSLEIIDFDMKNCENLCYYPTSYNHSRPEQFIKHNSGLQILDTGRTLTGTSNIDSVGVAFGDIIIKPKENPEMIAKWKFKVNANYNFIGMGSDYNHDCIGNYGDDGLVVSIDDWNDDIIQMELNIPKRKLIFHWNDKFIHTAENDIDMSKEYHLMVLMTRKQKNSIKLIDFKMRNQKILSFYSE